MLNGKDVLNHMNSYDAIKMANLCKQTGKMIDVTIPGLPFYTRMHFYDLKFINLSNHVYNHSKIEDNTIITKIIVRMDDDINDNDLDNILNLSQHHNVHGLYLCHKIPNDYRTMLLLCGINIYNYLKDKQ